MTFYEYKLLDAIEQAIVLWDKGGHLGKCFNGAYNLLLYPIDGFYVEALYHRKQNTIVRLRSFKSTGQLRPYVDKMDVAGLV